MAAVLQSALFAAVARVVQAMPSIDELLHSMNRNEALRDGSRFF